MVRNGVRSYHLGWGSVGLLVDLVDRANWRRREAADGRSRRLVFPNTVSTWRGFILMASIPLAVMTVALVAARHRLDRWDVAVYAAMYLMYLGRIVFDFVEHRRSNRTMCPTCRVAMGERDSDRD